MSNIKQIIANNIISHSINKNCIYYIYGLYDNENNLFYIGLTINPSKRLKEHLRTTNRKMSQVIFENNYNINIKIISIFYDINLAKEFEAILINRFSNILTNIKDESYRL